jgi:hypothetical protein
MTTFKRRPLVRLDLGMAQTLLAGGLQDAVTFENENRHSDIYTNTRRFGFTDVI